MELTNSRWPEIHVVWHHERATASHASSAAQLPVTAAAVSPQRLAERMNEAIVSLALPTLASVALLVEKTPFCDL